MHERIIGHLKKFETIIITGGSSGIGMAFIKSIETLSLSCTVCNISRTEPNAIFSSITLNHYPCDLSEPDRIPALVEQLESELAQSKGKILLINNSGYGSYGFFPEPSLTTTLNMLDLNIRAVVELTGRLLPRIIQSRGAVINIASTAAWQPTPYMAAYGASKAFVLQWSLALNEELKQRQVPVLAVCPGPTESSFFKRAGFGESPLAGWGQTADEVVAATWQALAAGRSLVVSGWWNKLLVVLSCRLPRRLQAPLAGMVLRRMRLEAFQQKKAGAQ